MKTEKNAGLLAYVLKYKLEVPEKVGHQILNDYASKLGNPTSDDIEKGYYRRYDRYTKHGKEIHHAETDRLLWAQNLASRLFDEKDQYKGIHGWTLTPDSTTASDPE